MFRKVFDYLLRATWAAMTRCRSTTNKQLVHWHSFHRQSFLCPFRQETTPWLRHRAHLGVRNNLCLPPPSTIFLTPKRRVESMVILMENPERHWTLFRKNLRLSFFFTSGKVCLLSFLSFLSFIFLIFLLPQMRLNQNVGCLFSSALWLAVDVQERRVCLAKKDESVLYKTRDTLTFLAAPLFFFEVVPALVENWYGRAPPPETWRVSHFRNIVFYYSWIERERQTRPSHVFTRKSSSLMSIHFLYFRITRSNELILHLLNYTN